MNTTQTTYATVRIVLCAAGMALGVVPMSAIMCPVHGQQPTATSSGVIQGDVRRADNHAVIGGATIDLSSNRFSRRVRSEEDGKFRIGSVPEGTYRLLVMRVGFQPLRIDVETDGDAADVHITLTPDANTLSTIVTRANVTAIYGGIGAVGPSTNSLGEKSMTSVAGATIQVLGAKTSGVSDSAGRFFVELPKPGRYIVRVTSPGLAPQVFPVDVPKNKAIEASRLMDSVVSSAPTGREYLWDEMDRRLSWRTAMSSALISGSELRDIGGSLSTALQFTKDLNRSGLRIGNTTCVFVNGVARPNMPLDAIRIEEIEAIELYSERGDQTQSLNASWPKGAGCGGKISLRGTAAGTPVAKWAIIWTVR